MRDERIIPFRKAQVISAETDPTVYLATGKDYPRGDKQFIMSSGNLNTYLTNPNKWRLGGAVEESKTWSMDFGSWLDCNLLVPSLAPTRFAVTPETYEDVVMECPRCESQTDSKRCAKCKVDRVEKTLWKPWNKAAGACDEWREREEQAGRHVIGHKINAGVKDGLKVLQANEAVTRLVEGSEHQVFCLAEYHDADTGIVVPVKMLADMVPTVDPWQKAVFDLKSARIGNPAMWPRVAFKSGYHVQLALYCDILEATGKYGERSTGAHLVVENEQPYHVTEPFPALSEEFIKAGRDRYQAALAHYCQALKTGIWTGYPVPAGTLVFDHLQFLGPPYQIFEMPEDHPGAPEAPASGSEYDPDDVIP